MTNHWLQRWELTSIDGPSGNMIVDIGGGTTEIAIISLNGIVYAQSVRIGGDAFDEAIITYVRRRYGCLIGEATAENIKLSIATAFPTGDDLVMEISGRLSRGRTKKSWIMQQWSEALAEPLTGIIGAIRTVPEQVPPAFSWYQPSWHCPEWWRCLAKKYRSPNCRRGWPPVVIADNPKTCVVRVGKATQRFWSSGSRFTDRGLGHLAIYETTA